MSSLLEFMKTLWYIAGCLVAISTIAILLKVLWTIISPKKKED